MKDLIILRSNLENMRDYASLGVFDNEKDCLLAANKLLNQVPDIAKTNQFEYSFSGLVMDYHKLNRVNEDCYSRGTGWDVLNHHAVLLENGFSRLSDAIYLRRGNFLESSSNLKVQRQFDISELLATANQFEKPYSVEDFKRYKFRVAEQTLIANDKFNDSWVTVQARIAYQINQYDEVQAVDVITDLATYNYLKH